MRNLKRVFKDNLSRYLEWTIAVILLGICIVFHVGLWV